MKTSITISDELAERIKEFNKANKGRKISISGVAEDALLRMMDEIEG